MKKYTLFIDESGNINFNSPNSELYILCGCAVEDKNRNDLKIHADQIKFKYWNQTDIVLHSREIARDEGDFQIFKNDQELKKKFQLDLLKFLRNSTYTILPVVVNKELANKKHWTREKIIQKTANYVISNYLRFLFTKRNASGKVVIEFSNVYKDKFYLSSFNYFTGPSCKELSSVGYKTIQKKLTSLSFVTKHNHDIEEQIADLIAYAVKCKYQKIKNKNYNQDSYEKSLIKILDSKLLFKPKKPNKKKKPFFDQIESFGILP